jgi:hypothetical protein
MTPYLTIAYITARKEPKFQWFIDSLYRQMEGIDFGKRFQILIIDFYARERQLPPVPAHLSIRWEKPAPTVWQGIYRLTKSDYFAMANARNTALCLAPDGWICYVDDCSVLMPGWVEAIIRSMKREDTITLGAYRKVKNLVVENGLVTSYEGDHLGVDTRNRKGKTGPIMCRGEWHYGCSLIAPTEAYLSINGWDENCDGMGYEDVVTGTLLENAGWKFVYDPAMMTYESQELHHMEEPMKRVDKGISPNDKSHAILQSTRMRKWAPNYFGDEGIRGLRQKVLNGMPFPPISCPEHDWFDKQPLSEM